LERRKVQAPGADGSSKTQAHHAKGARVSDIVSRHAPGQSIGDPRATRQPRFMDVPSETYHEALNRVCDVKNQFMSLGSRLRGRFANDPFQMLRFVEDPKNRAEALKMGLLVPTEEEAEALSIEAMKARRGEQVDLIREAMKADPEAQPTFKKPKAPEGD